MGKIKNIISNWENSYKERQARIAKEKEELVVQRTENLIRNMNIVVDSDVDYDALKAIANIDPDYIDNSGSFSVDEYGNGTFYVKGFDDLKDLINVVIEQNFILMRKVDSLNKRLSAFEDKNNE